jgi:transcriptional regulator with XRE-family HTH domain
MQTEERMQQQEALGKRLRLFREGAGRTPQEAADLLGLQSEALTEIEAGRRRVDIFELAALWKFYKVRPAVLFAGLIENAEENWSGFLMASGFFGGKRYSGVLYEESERKEL